MWMLLGLGFGLCAAAWAEDWPQFRGPTGQGNSAETGLPLAWSESKNIVWKTPVPGRGWSSPAIQGDRIWLTSAADPEGLAASVANLLLRGRSLRAIALDRATGRIVHNVEVFRLTDAGSMHAKNSHASPTPVVEGDRVYVHFGAHGTAALTSSGEILWKTRLPYNHLHGTGGSPVVFGDLLIVSCDGTDVQYVAALDIETGRIRWKSNRSGAMAYSTPLVIRAEGVDQVISPGGLRAVSYDPRTGKELWWVRYGEGFSNVPRPVYRHGLAYICTGFYQPALMAVRPDGKGEIGGSHVAWTERRSMPLTPSPVVEGDEIYTVSDNGIASCLDARTGKAHWRERIGGNHSASPVAADGRIYFLNEAGECTVIAAGKTYDKLAVNTLDGQTLASIAVSGGSLFIRSATHLYRIADPGAQDR
ncbi:MAG: PQQ-binding-like beta-propeller repeat protein [Bryobacteraceae bacterium]|nr:PQQ-binding-like beta-propeller repeat protein [Bryobacteraceae bacterium]